MSSTEGAKVFAGSVRKHWGIENQQEKSRGSVKTKRHRAAWYDSYQVKVLSQEDI